MQKRTKYHIGGATNLDESLIGLRAATLLATGQTKDIKSAQQYFGRKIIFTQD